MYRHAYKLLCIFILITLAAACSGNGGEETPNEEEVPIMIQITSTAFAEGEPIPQQYTCDGDDISPPLTWTNIPDGTQSLALINDDPDAPRGAWVHWVVYAIPPDVTELEAAIPADETLENGARQGINDFRRIGYGGPCPPRGNPHHYLFKLYALDAALDLAPGATKAELEEAMEGHILEETILIGTYQSG